MDSNEMELPLKPSSLLVTVEGVIHKIPVKRPAEETLRSICNEALVQHLTNVLDFKEDVARSTVLKESLKVARVQEKNGIILGINRTMMECLLPGEAILIASINGSDKDLLERMQKMSLVFIQKINQSGSFDQGANLDSKLKDVEGAHSDFKLNLSIKDTVRRIGVSNPSHEILKNVCKEAIIGYVKQIQFLREEDALKTIEKQNISVLSASDGGIPLDLDTTVLRNGISNGATISLVVEGIDASRQSMEPGETFLRESVFLRSDILMATDNYSEQSIVGKGGQATVYKGYIDGSLVAIKKYSTLDLKDMELEVKVLQEVRHPNVILLMGYCMEEKCIISEFMEGGSLQDRLENEFLMTWIDKYRVVQEIVSAVCYLHKHNILHRDLKPANVMFDRHGTVKITDMGLAKLSAEIVSASAIHGTVGYVDPEYITLRKTSPSLDVYAIGLIILQLCTHKSNIEEIHKTLSVIDDGERTRSAMGLKLLKPLLETNDSTLPQSEIHNLLEIGLQCSERRSKNRPNLQAVIKKLQSAQALNLQRESVKWYAGAARMGKGITQSFWAPGRWMLGRQTHFSTELSVPSIPGEIVDAGDGFFTRRFTLQEVMAATDSFSDVNFLRRGGYGHAYVGYFSEGNRWAVKRADPRLSNQHIPYFTMEVKMMAKVTHRNLVALKGFCDESGEQILIYEFVGNGSLRQHIKRDEKVGGKVLTADQRINIAVDVAKGLDHLHRVEGTSIIHRNVKSSHILLDDKLAAKLTDFSMIVPLDSESMTHVSTDDIAGTFGYMDPEYLSTRRVSRKSDVYSYGVVLLELVTGKNSIIKLHNEETNETNYDSLVTWIKGLTDGGAEIGELVDPALELNYHPPVMNKMFQLALRCTKRESKERPDMRDIVIELEILRKQNHTLSGMESGSHELSDDDSSNGKPMSGSLDLIGTTDSTI